MFSSLCWEKGRKSGTKGFKSCFPNVCKVKTFKLAGRAGFWIRIRIRWIRYFLQDPDPLKNNGSGSGRRGGEGGVKGGEWGGEMVQDLRLHGVMNLHMYATLRSVP